MNTNNICLNVCTILFFLFLLGVYISKKNMDNIENKIYRQLLYLNFVTLFVHMIWLFVGDIYRDNQLILQITCGVYMVLVDLWAFFFNYYMVMVSNENNPKFKTFFNKNKNKINIALFVLMSIICTIQLILPLEATYSLDGMLETAIGPNITFGYVIVLIFMVISTISFILNRKNLNRKKVFPFFITILLLITSVVISTIAPYLCVTIILITLISYLMYHTIENPDVKLITELTFAKEQAEKASNAKSDFLSSMSHEIRTPLNAIVGLSNSVRDSVESEDIRQDMDDIIVSSQKLVEIIDGILEMNKLETNEVKITEVNYNPLELFQELIKIVNIRIGEKPLEIRTNFSNSIPTLLYGDKEKVKVIMSNLLTNAVKYTNSGYIDFNVDCVNINDKCTLRITISDTGRGIAEDKVSNIFTKFYRLEEDKDTDIEGTGLGLSITKSLVEILGGKITVDSTFGVGTTVLVTISQKIVENNLVNDNNNIKEKIEVL